MTCIICDKISEKKAMIAYEDDDLIAILPSKPAVPGHVKIMPKKHFTKLDDMSSDLVEELFFLANFASSAVFEVAKAHGTNIILNESDNHLAVDVIPRKENDGLNFMWKPKQISPAEIDEIHAKITDKAFLVARGDEFNKVAKQEETKEVIAETEGKKKTEEAIKEEPKDPKKGKINYLIKHLIKIP